MTLEYDDLACSRCGRMASVHCDVHRLGCCPTSRCPGASADQREEYRFAARQAPKPEPRARKGD